MTVENLQQLHERQRRLGPSGLVARKGIDSAAENLGRLTLVERELFANAGDEARVDHGCIDLFVELQHRRAYARRLGGIQDDFAAGRQNAPLTPSVVVISPL